MATISIITIVFNGLPHLPECVNSVLGQDFQDWELLISDDGSIDGSRDYLDTIQDKRVKVFKQKQNLGIFGNLNFLFSKASAPLSQILCQDDYFSTSSSLNVILKYWSKTPLDVGFVRFNHFSEEAKQLVAYEQKIVPEIIKAGEAGIWFYAFGNLSGNLSNITLRTSIITNCGFFNQKFPYAGDMEFWVRASQKVSMGIESTEVVIIRRHTNVASNFLNTRGELLAQKQIILTNLYKDLVKKNKYPKILLKLHGTVNFDSQQRYVALLNWMKGNKHYYKSLKIANNKAQFLLPALSRWILFLLTLGGKWGRVITCKMLLKYNI